MLLLYFAHYPLAIYGLYFFIFSGRVFEAPTLNARIDSEMQSSPILPMANVGGLGCLEVANTTRLDRVARCVCCPSAPE